VTATSRILSPKRAIFNDCRLCQALAARTQTPMLDCTSSSCQKPTTTFRFIRMRVFINPNSRSPWADWLRFMKSISISDQGISRLNWVCRCRIGFFRIESPEIHIFAGEKVCDQSYTVFIRIRLETSFPNGFRIR